MVEKKKTSIRINPKVWKKAKKEAIDRDETVGEFIENLIKKEVDDSNEIQEE